MSSRAGGVLYLDSSAIVKLAVREPETAALEAELVRWPLCATSSITAIEVGRAAARARQQQRDVLPPRDVTSLLSTTVEMVLTDRVRQRASTLAPPELRALDADPCRECTRTRYRPCRCCHLRQAHAKNGGELQVAGALTYLAAYRGRATWVDSIHRWS